MKTKTIAPQRLTIDGKKFVLLREQDFQMLATEADFLEPPMPQPLPSGNYPALETVRALVACSIIRQRRKLGWSQEELAKRAGVRLPTLRRIEIAEHPPSAAAL